MKNELHAHHCLIDFKGTPISFVRCWLLRIHSQRNRNVVGPTFCWRAAHFGQTFLIFWKLKIVRADEN